MASDDSRRTSESEALFEEIGVLQEIYISELQIISDESNFPTCVSIDLRPSTGEHVATQYVFVNLSFHLSTQYPNQLPGIVLKNPKGLADNHVDSIRSGLNNLAEERTGGPMLYELIEFAKDMLTESNVPHGQCVICLETFETEEALLKTDCFHYFHCWCILPYIDNILEAHRQECEALPVHMEVPECKVVCPICREPMMYDLQYLRQFQPSEEENGTAFIGPEIRGMQKRMQSLFLHQKAKGAIIDLEEEKDRHLIDLDQLVSLPASNTADQSLAKSVASGFFEDRDSVEHQCDEDGHGNVSAKRHSSVPEKNVNLTEHKELHTKPSRREQARNQSSVSRDKNWPKRARNRQGGGQSEISGRKRDVMIKGKYQGRREHNHGEKLSRERNIRVNQSSMKADTSNQCETKTKEGFDEDLEEKIASEKGETESTFVPHSRVPFDHEERKSHDSRGKSHKFYTTYRNHRPHAHYRVRDGCARVSKSNDVAVHEKSGAFDEDCDSREECHQKDDNSNSSWGHSGHGPEKLESHRPNRRDWVYERHTQSHQRGRRGAGRGQGHENHRAEGTEVRNASDQGEVREDKRTACAKSPRDVQKARSNNESYCGGRRRNIGSRRAPSTAVHSEFDDPASTGECSRPSSSAVSRENGSPRGGHGVEYRGREHGRRTKSGNHDGREFNNEGKAMSSQSREYDKTGQYTSRSKTGGNEVLHKGRYDPKNKDNKPTAKPSEEAQRSSSVKAPPGFKVSAPPGLR